LKPATAIHECGFKVIQIMKVTIDKGLINQFPEMFSRLKFRRMSRQEPEAEMRRTSDMRTGVVTGLINEKRNAVYRAPPQGFPTDVGAWLQPVPFDLQYDMTLDHKPYLSSRRFDCVTSVTE
jgi:hypothetical protein